MEFRAFAALVNERFNQITAQGEVFHVDASRDDLWTTYLDSFPDGTNPIFRERAQHDCSTCRQFIRGVGGIVTLGKDGNLQTVWDVKADGFYAEVAQAMAEFVRCGSINRVYRSREPSYGTLSNAEKVEGGSDITWHHFHAKLPKRLVVNNVGEANSEFDAAHQVLGRGLGELTLGALEIVLDLIESNSLYRGEEHKKAVRGFLSLKKQYDALPKERQEGFVWANLDNRAARFRNTAIGTMVQDISEGMEIPKAVGRFEAKVAPHNYRRTSAPITKGMIEKALGTLKDLGLEDAVHRRYAAIGDVSPSDVLFVDRSVSPLMKDPLKDLLMPEAKAPKLSSKGAIDISGEDFFESVLPGAVGLELHLERRHLGNFVSLTAPQGESTGRLFHWNNDYAWCYDGDIADSDMRRAVEAAGGRVDGVFRFTHSWNHDDRVRNASLMDLHVFMPGSHATIDNGIHDRYGNDQRVGWNHRKHNQSGGVQDVDYVHRAPADYIPVENITFPKLRQMSEGRYVCKIHNWSLRQPTKGGFRAEIEFGEQLFEYEYRPSMKNKEWVTVAEVTLKNGLFTIKHHLEPKSSQATKWGVTTGTKVPVEAVMLSPNYWSGQGQGNKHHVFVLRDCCNPEPSRGFFNEFLRSDLHEHRKVFEVLAGKLKCQPTGDQLSGVGFSSTRKDTITIAVQKDGATRTYNVQF
jgi:hypothetical protein